MLSGLLQACECVSDRLLTVVIKVIKHLATSPQMIEILHQSNAIEVLVSLLANNLHGARNNVSFILWADTTKGP